MSFTQNEIAERWEQNVKEDTVMPFKESGYVLEGFMLTLGLYQRRELHSGI